MVCKLTGIIELQDALKQIDEVYGKGVLSEIGINSLDNLVEDGNIKALSNVLKDELLLISLRERKKAEQEILLFKMYKCLNERVLDLLGDSFYEELLTELDVRSSWKLTVSRMVRYRDVKKREKAMMTVLNSINFSLYEVDVRKLQELFGASRDVRYKDAIIKVLSMCNKVKIANKLKGKGA